MGSVSPSKADSNEGSTCCLLLMMQVDFGNWKGAEFNPVIGAQKFADPDWGAYSSVRADMGAPSRLRI